MSKIRPGTMYFIPPRLIHSGAVIFEYDWATQMYKFAVDSDVAAEIVAMELRTNAEWNEVKDYGRSLGTPAESSDGAQ